MNTLKSLLIIVFFMKVLFGEDLTFLALFYCYHCRVRKLSLMNSSRISRGTGLAFLSLYCLDRPCLLLFGSFLIPKTDNLLSSNAVLGCFFLVLEFSDSTFILFFVFSELVLFLLALVSFLVVALSFLGVFEPLELRG